jgi:hypothetical protein
MGCRTPEGYGKLCWQGKQDRYAHRVAYQLAHGPIPDGRFVCHACDNPSCCNPRHLWLGTPLDNIQDRDRKGRNGLLKATNEVVEEIARLRVAGVSAADISQQVGLHEATIYRVLKRQAVNRR